MIYKDAYACFDNFERPSRREEPCINCGKAWEYHAGWSCDVNHCRSFEDTYEHSRYLTQSMLDSVLDNPKPIKKDEELTWQYFVCKEPGFCPCGVAREVCDYHRV